MSLEKKLNIAAGIVLVIIGYFFFLKPVFIDVILLNKYFDYSTGVLTEVDYTTEGAPGFKVIYYVNGKKYTNSLSKDTRHFLSIGDCYEVKYCTIDPNIAEVHLDKPCYIHQ